MHIEFIASVSIIAADVSANRDLFLDTLGLPLAPPPGDPQDEYVYTEQVGGARHFGVWPLWQAAQSCFGTREWPSERPVPQISVEFEVASEAAVDEAAAELAARGYALLHAARTEPWGQVVARIQTQEGAIIGISFAPWVHGDGGT